MYGFSSSGSGFLVLVLVLRFSDFVVLSMRESSVVATRGERDRVSTRLSVVAILVHNSTVSQTMANHTIQLC